MHEGRQETIKAGAVLRRALADRKRLQYLNALLPLMAMRLREMTREPLRSVPVTQRWGAVSVRTGPGDPTAAAIERAERVTQRDDYRLAERKLRELTAEKERLEKRAKWFECALRALTRQEQLLLEARLLDGLPWPRVAELYEQEFGVRMHPDTLRRRLRAAVRELEELSGPAFFAG